MLNDIIDLFNIFTIYSKAQVFVYMFNLSYRSCAILLLFLTFVFKSKVVRGVASLFCSASNHTLERGSCFFTRCKIVRSEVFSRVN